MNGAAPTAWQIEGSGPVADALRAAARVIPAAAPVTILVDTDEDMPAAFALGTAALHSSAGQVVPLEAAFEAVEAVRQAVVSGDTGPIYGCFTSIRIPRGSSPAEVLHGALLPAVALALDIVPGEPRRVWARKASLFSPDDAWFATLRMLDETLLTVEALASERNGEHRSILVELTSSARVLRAEPCRQAVVVERFDRPTQTLPWWEDLSERYLHLVQQRAATPDAGAGQRLRAVWHAIVTSAQEGQPLDLK